MQEPRINRVEADLRERPRRWAVTGAAGFIGSHLCERLLRLGQEVVGIDNLSTGYLRNIEDVRRSIGRDLGEAAAARLRFEREDVRDPAALARCFDGVDHVLHQAAMASVPRSMETPHLHHEHNTDGFFRVLEAARGATVKSLVYASSSSVYGDHPALPKREQDTGEVLSPYAATKACNEVYATAWSRAFGLPVYGIRYFNVFGPRQDPNGAYAAVIPRWIDTLARGERPVIFGDGETSRDFCPVANVVQVNLLAALPDPAPENRVFNVALGGRTTLNELFELLRDGLTQLGAPCSDIEATYADFRPGDIRHSLADITRARVQLGYVPQVSREQGLALTMRWFFDRRPA